MNLSKYVKNLLFLDSFEKEKKEFIFDAIVLLGCDKNVDTNPKHSVSIFILPDTNDVGNSFVVEFQKIKKKYKNILCILDQFTVSSMNSSGNIWSEFNGIVINLFTGISSLGYKVSTELRDIVEMQKRGFTVLEPYDLGSFLELLNYNRDLVGSHENKKYIRLTGIEISAKLLQDEHEKVHEYRLLSMDKFGLGGESATVLTSGNYLGTVVQSVHILNNQGIFVDVYAILDYSFDLREDLKKSVARTEKLIVILDAKKNVFLEKLIVSKFPLQKGLEIRFVYPEYEKITAYMDEYRPDQARFDQVALMESILIG